jgi:uncharacterized BrkB/YihY/UPF0761 family membrane protein
MNANIVKFAVACVFLGVVIVWQQHYFQAIDDIDGNTTTLWNWPAAVLICFGVAAAVFGFFRVLARRKCK